MTAKSEGKSFNSDLEYELAARTSELKAQQLQLKILKEKLNGAEISESTYVKKVNEAKKKIPLLEDKIADLEKRIGAAAGHKSSEATSGKGGEKVSTPPGRSKKLPGQPSKSSVQVKNVKSTQDKSKDKVGQKNKEKGTSMFIDGRRQRYTGEGFNWWKIILPALIIVILGIVAWIAVPIITLVRGTDIQSNAPDFSGQSLDGKSVSLNDYKGKNLLLEFWGSSTNVTEEWAITDTISRANASSNIFPVVIISGNNTSIISSLKNKPLSYPVVPDNSGDIAARFKVGIFPTTFFIDAAQIIRHVRFGSLYSGDGIDTVFSPAGKDTSSANSMQVITDVSVLSITETSAVITWSTTALADSQLDYKYGKNVQTVSDKTMDKRHSIVLGKLSSGTEYQLTIKSKTAQGLSSSVSAYSFRTLKDTTPPLITEAGTSGVAQTTISITWNTDEPATSQIEYGTTGTLGTATPLDSTMILSHAISISGLTPDTQYYIRIKSQDMAGNTAVYDLKPMNTKAVLLEEIKLGMKAPAFSLKTVVDGKTVSLADFKGRKVVLVFFSIDCAACRVEIPMIQEQYKMIQDWKVNIMAISADKSIDDIKAYIDKNKITFPILHDPEWKANDTYLVPLTPYNVFISSDGNIAALHEGRYSTVNDLITAIQDLK
jgi:peroxiredoxin